MLPRPSTPLTSAIYLILDPPSFFIKPFKIFLVSIYSIVYCCKKKKSGLFIYTQI